MPKSRKSSKRQGHSTIRGTFPRKGRERNRKDDQGQNKLHEGVIASTAKGAGFVAVPEYDDDVAISPQRMNTALNRDLVSIRILPEKEYNRVQAEVVRVTERAKTRFVGTVVKENGSYLLKPDDRKMYTNILITGYKDEPKAGDKVLVKFTEWKNPRQFPEGEIVRVIGRAGDHDVEMQSIVIEQGFSIDFPHAVEQEAETIRKAKKPIPKEDFENRKDMRNTTTFTIDPKDAKDFDDAISFVALPNDRFEIGVHIADVSHYVTEGTALDKEAKKRGFSVYLVDRTIPMLPEALSNDLCSLNPNEDKLAFSAVFEMDKSGKIFKRWFGKTIINSNKRFTYEEAAGILDAKEGIFYEELATLNEIAEELRKVKAQQGAIEFSQDEVRVELDENDKPVRIYKKARLATHHLVEEFMLLANREVAQFCYDAFSKKKVDAPFLFRIHDNPNPEKINELSIFIRALGFELPLTPDGGVTNKDLQVLLKQIEGHASEALIKTAAVRSMAKAVYSVSNIGHFGLAFEYYTHFTSPIRRYPDLLVHRLLFRHLADHKIPQNEFERLQKLASDSTQKEIAAAEAERDSVKYKQVEFFKEKIGQTFDGIVSGVTEWGIYIEEKETRTEGMVRLRDIQDDYFVLDVKNYAIVGKKSGKTYTLGDTVKFTVMGADVERKTLDFRLV